MGMYLDGNNQYLIVPNDTSLNVDYVTIVCWVKINQYRNYNGVFAKGDGDAGTGEAYELYVASNTIYGQIKTTSHGQIAIGAADIPASGWYHLAMTWDGTTQKMFINGIRKGTTTAISNSGVLQHNTLPLYFGRLNNASYGFLDGEMFDCRVYNRALSELEILAIINSKGSDKIIDGLVGRWLMMERPEGSISNSNGLELWHKMESAGNSEVGVNPASVGTPDFTYDGKWGKGLYLDPANDGNTIRFFNILIATPGKFSFTFTFKPNFNFADAFIPSFARTFSYYKYSTWEGSCSVGWWPDKTFWVDFYDVTQFAGECDYKFNNAINFSAGDEVTITVIYDYSASAGSRVRCFQNGTELTVSSVGNDGLAMLSHFNMAFGAPGYPEVVADAVVDNFKFYNRVLTQDEVTFDVNNEGINSNIGIRQIIYDSSGNGNHGASYNYPVYKATPLKLKNPRRGK